MNIDHLAVPSWLEMDRGYAKLIENSLFHFSPWWIIDDVQFIHSYNEGLKQRYPDRDLFCFAKRLDCDLIAAFSREHVGKIVLINDFSSEGWEIEDVYESFWAWFKSLIDHFIEID